MGAGKAPGAPPRVRWHSVCTCTSGRHVDETRTPALPPEPLPADLRRRRHLRGPAPPLVRGQPDPAPVDALHRHRGHPPLFKAKACGFLVILRRLGDQPFVHEALVVLATVYTFFSFIPWMSRLLSLLFV